MISTATRSKQAHNNQKGFEAPPETRIPTALAIDGTIPSYVTGTLYRCGPASWGTETNKKKQFKVNHWFDGFSMTHKFDIQGSQILYTSKFATDKYIEQVKKDGNLEKFITFGQSRDPCDGLFSKLKTSMIPKLSKEVSCDNINVTISDAGDGKLMSRTDANKLQGIDQDTLEPVYLGTYADAHPELKGQLSAAHGETDHSTKEYFNFTLDVVSDCYTVFKEVNGEVKILAKIKGQKSTYIHSFWLTKDYVVIGIWQAFLAGGLPLLWHRNGLDTISKKWDASGHTKFVVIDRNGKGIVKTCSSPDAFFCFHTINAYQDDNNDIVLDLCHYKTNSILTALYLKNINTASKDVVMAKDRECSYATRYVLSSSGVEKVDFGLPNIELPIINPNYACRKYRYVYGVYAENSPLGESIIKLDLLNKTSSTWTANGSPNPGEPIFVANPNGVDEDDGVLLTVVLDGVTGTSSLVVLDARDLSVLATAQMKTHVPLGFHGTYTN